MVAAALAAVGASGGKWAGGKWADAIALRVGRWFPGGFGGEGLGGQATDRVERLPVSCCHGTHVVVFR